MLVVELKEEVIILLLLTMEREKNDIVQMHVFFRSLMYHVAKPEQLRVGK